MKRARTVPVAAVLLGLVLGGCVHSIHPVVPESAATFDERLIGTWGDTGSADRAVIRRGTGNSYVIDYTTDGKTSPLGARLGRIGGQDVLDVWPLTPASEHEELPGALMAPVHLLVVVQIKQNEVAFSLLGRDSMAVAIESGAVRLDHESFGQRLILTNPTAELRTGIEAYLRRTGGLSKPDIFRRQ